MKIKRLISLLLTLMLLAGTAPALASDAGSRQDPLLSHSFVDSWSSAVLSHAEATAHSAAQAALDKALQTHDAALHSTAAKSRICTLNAGSTVALKTGDCFTVLSGSAGVTISAGVLVDTTDGKKAASGALHTAHRYIACENLRATITCEQTVSLLVSASASVTRFVDVPAGAWYADAVEDVAANGLMDGVGGRCFAPNDALTRAMFVTVLGRLVQINEADYTSVSFTDVTPGSWYAPYVEWAAQQNIVNGMSSGRFEPNTPITREQMATIIARYVQSTGKALPTITDPVTLRDMNAVSDWARDGVELMRTTGIIAGDERGYFNPRGLATRAQAATVFMRLRERACARKHNHKTIGSAEPAAPPICTKEFSHGAHRYRPRVSPGERPPHVRSTGSQARLRRFLRHRRPNARPLPVHRQPRPAQLHRRGHGRAAVPRLAGRAACGTAGAVRRRGAAGAGG